MGRCGGVRAGKAELDRARCLLGSLRSAQDSGEGRGWAWRGGPQVHSPSAMQMRCKSARASGRPQCESGRGASRFRSLSFTRVRSRLAPLLPLWPGRSPPPRSAGSRPDAPHRPSRQRRRSERWPRLPDAVPARVSEPVPRFCPSAALGVPLRGRGPGAGGGDPPSEACPGPLVGDRFLCAARSWRVKGASPGLPAAGFSWRRCGARDAMLWSL